MTVLVPAEPWPDGTAGLLVLPSGLRVRGRGLSRAPRLEAGPLPTYALHVTGSPPEPADWPVRWVRWPDFRLPADREDAVEALRETYDRLGTDRVEVACGGGRGRTGTALACLVALDTGRSGDAVTYVRDQYDRHAVETWWQRRYVTTFLD